MNDMNTEALQFLFAFHEQMNPNASDDDNEHAALTSLELWQDVNNRLQKIMNAHQRVDDLWFNFEEISAAGPFGAFDYELQEDMKKVCELLYELDPSTIDNLTGPNALFGTNSAPQLTLKGYCKAIKDNYEKYGELMTEVLQVEQKLKERYTYASESVAVRRSRIDALKDIFYGSERYQRYAALTSLTNIFQLTKDNVFKPYAKYLFNLDPYHAIKLYALTLRNAKNKDILNQLISQNTITPKEKAAFKKELINILKTHSGIFTKKDLWQNVPVDIKAWLNTSTEEDASYIKQARIETMKKELKSVVEKMNPTEREALISVLNEQLQKLYPEIPLDIHDEYSSNSPMNSTGKK